MFVKEKVRKSANQLESVAALILVLSILGAIVILGIGFLPVCPQGNFDCSSDDEGLYNAPLFTGVAFAQALFSWLLFAFSSAFSSLLRLKEAESSFVELLPPPKTERVKSKLGWSEERKMALLSEDQLTDWILGGQPPLTHWNPVEPFEEWLQKSAGSET